MYMIAYSISFSFVVIHSIFSWLPYFQVYSILYLGPLCRIGGYYPSGGPNFSNPLRFVYLRVISIFSFRSSVFFTLTQLWETSKKKLQKRSLNINPSYNSPNKNNQNNNKKFEYQLFVFLFLFLFITRQIYYIHSVYEDLQTNLDIIKEVLEQIDKEVIDDLNQKAQAEFEKALKEQLEQESKKARYEIYCFFEDANAFFEEHETINDWYYSDLFDKKCGHLFKARPVLLLEYPVQNAEQNN